MGALPYDYARELQASYPDLRERWREGAVVPTQVEIHLPPSGAKLCWLKCPHCYTRGGPIRGEIIRTERIVALIGQIAAGSPRSGSAPPKIVLSGVETDPVNSGAIDAVGAAVKDAGLELGIHTKALRLPPALIDRLVARNTRADYVSFSIDAGTSPTYDLVHGLDGHRTSLYETVKRNVRQLVTARNAAGSLLKVRATYLITGQNATLDEVTRCVDDFVALGIDSLRFSVPIVARMAERDERGRFPLVAPADLAAIEREIAARNAHDHRIVFQRFDANTRRTLPCYTRWLMPAIGYDGYLYPCCLVATSEFASLPIGDLKAADFWPTYHSERSLPYVNANCQCDRKAEEINRSVHQPVWRSPIRAAGS